TRAWTNASAEPVVYKEPRLRVVQRARRFPHRRALFIHSHSRKHFRQELPHDGFRHRWPRNKRSSAIFTEFLTTISVQPLCSLCLCGSNEEATTETQRTLRLHREEFPRS